MLNKKPQVIYELMLDKDLSKTDILVHAIVISNKDPKTHELSVTNREIAEITGTTKISVSRSISKLEKKGYLKTKIIRDGRKQVMDRIIIDLKKFNNLPAQEEDDHYTYTRPDPEMAGIYSGLYDPEFHGPDNSVYMGDGMWLREDGSSMHEKGR